MTEINRYEHLYRESNTNFESQSAMILEQAHYIDKLH